MTSPWHGEEACSLLSGLAPGKDSALLHLLTCPTCRTWATRRVLQKLGTGEKPPDEEAIWSRLHRLRPMSMIEEALHPALRGRPEPLADLGIPTLETERLRLLPFRGSDFDDYAALCADPEVSRYLAVRFSSELAVEPEG